MPLTKEELEEILRRKREELGLSPDTGLGYRPPRVTGTPGFGEGYRPVGSEELETGWESLWALLHGTTSGMTLGGSEKLMDLLFGEAAGQRRQELSAYPGMQEAGRFGGMLFPYSRGIRGAGWLVNKLPYLSKLPQLARSVIANTIAGGAIGSMEMKTEKENRLGKIGKEAAIFGGITGVLGGMQPTVRWLADRRVYEVLTPTGKKVIAKTLEKAREIATGGFPLTYPKVRSQVVEKAPKLAEAAQFFVQRKVPPGFRERMRGFEGEKGMLRQEAGEVGTKLAALPPAEQIRARQIISGGVTTRPDLAEATKIPIQRFERLTKTLQESPEGVLGKVYHQRLTKTEVQTLMREREKLIAQTGRKWEHAKYPGQAEHLELLQEKIGKIDQRLKQHYHVGGGVKYGGTRYFPRMFLSKEQDQNLLKWGLFRAVRFKGKRSYLKAREDIPDHILKNMGEIMYAPYPVRKRMTQIGGDLATWNLLDDIARKSEWSTTSEAIAKERGFVKITKTPTWGLGPLRKSWVHPEVAGELNEIFTIPGKWAQAYNKGIGYWKFGKVIPRPASWGRNIFANVLFADLAGVKPWRLESMKTLEKAFGDYVKNGPMRRELAKRGLLGTEFLPVEAKEIFKIAKESKGNMFDFFLQVPKKGVRELGNFFTAQDQLFKQWIVMDRMAKGATMDKAVEAAFKWMPNYAEVPGVTKFLRSFPLPFFSFTSEATRIMGIAARERPLTFAKWLCMPKMMTEFSKRKLGFSEEEWKEVQRQMPDYMRGLRILGQDWGLHVLLPIGTKEKFRMWDLTYNMPWGDAIEYAGDPWRVISNPLVSTVAAIKTGVDPFTGRPIVSDAKPTTFEAMQDWAQNLIQQLLPSWTPGIPGTDIKGGYDYKALVETIQKTPRLKISGGIKTRTWPETIGSTALGIKTKEVEPKELRLRRMMKIRGEVGKLKGNYKRVMKDYIAWEEAFGYRKAEDKFRSKLDKIIAKILETIKELEPGEQQELGGELQDLWTNP